MSKSLGNTIAVDEEPEELRRKLAKAFTDPGKLRRNDPGQPEHLQHLHPAHLLLRGRAGRGDRARLPLRRARLRGVQAPARRRA